MKKFAYSMQNILNIKLKIEVQEKFLFQQAMNYLQEQEQKLCALEEKKTEYEEKMREAVSEQLKLLEIRQWMDAIETMKVMIRKQKGEVKRAEHQMEVARKRLEEAMKERKMHEQLREKALFEYIKAYEKEERTEIDELVSFSYAMKDEVGK